MRQLIYLLVGRCARGNLIVLLFFDLLTRHSKRQEQPGPSCST